MITNAVAPVEENSSPHDELPPPASFDFGALGVWATVAAGTLLLISAVFQNELNSQDWDPQYMRDIVERTLVHGGSYYENGIHNKGPIEPLVYHAATLISSYYSFWLAMSMFIALAAIVVAYGVTTAMHHVYSGRSARLAVAIAVFVHFTLTGADYSGKMYSRNIAVAMQSSALILILGDVRLSFPRSTGTPRFRSLARWIGAGALLGLSVQTVSTSALSCTVLSIAALGILHIRRKGNRDSSGVGGRESLAFVGAGVVAFLSAPMYYVARGLGDVFWKSWWTYGQYMTAATGKSLRRQIAVGWREQWHYYEQRPAAAISLLIFAGLTVGLWSRMTPIQKILHTLVPAWFLAASLEIVLTQRNSTHYYAVSAVPIAIGGALSAGWLLTLIKETGGLAQSWLARVRSFVPAAATVLILMASGSQSFFGGIRTAAAFAGTGNLTESRRTNQDGPTRSVQAVLDLVSADNDYLWAWTNEPWPYLTHHRVSATRFIWKSFLFGEIYLGRTSSDFVLPGTWKWFLDDLKEAKPAAYLEMRKLPIPEGSIAAKALSEGFTEAFSINDRLCTVEEIAAITGGQPTATPCSPDGRPERKVALRNDLYRSLTNPPAVKSAFQPPFLDTTSGWKIAPVKAEFTRTPTSQPDDVLPLFNEGCHRLDGILERQGSELGRFVLRFESYDAKGVLRRTRLGLEGPDAIAGDDGAAFLRLDSGANNHPQGTPFTVAVGDRSAALIVDGKIRAAVAMPPKARIVLQPGADRVTLSSLTTSPLACPIDSSSQHQ
jgi:hypothetical protein